ncbi:MAG: hypothetical protein C4326_07875 [Ignavibacteria bacterium]
MNKYSSTGISSLRFMYTEIFLTPHGIERKDEMQEQRTLHLDTSGIVCDAVNCSAVILYAKT